MRNGDKIRIEEIGHGQDLVSSIGRFFLEHSKNVHRASHVGALEVNAIMNITGQCCVPSDSTSVESKRTIVNATRVVRKTTQIFSILA